MGKFMTNTETIHLFKQIDELRASSNLTHDSLAKEISSIHTKIVKGLSFLVYSNAKMYRKFPNYEDLVQEGFIGLLRAVQKFDHTLFPNFFVYSERWIRHSVKRAASRFDVVYNPNKSRVIYACPSEVGQEAEVDDTPEKIFFNKERGKRIEEVLCDFPDRDRDIVKRIFGLGEYCSNPQTLREIGPVFDLTHERIRQIKNKVISKLRKNSGLGEL